MEPSLYKRIIISAGGTGGHVIPATVVVNELRNQGHFVKFITDQRGYNYVDQFSLSDTLILDLKSPSPNIQAKIIFFFKAFKAIRSCLVLYKLFKPDVIVGFGGYPSLPALIAARLLKIPIVIHEQNAVLGRTNRLLKSFARSVYTSFPHTAGIKKKAENLVRFPIRLKNSIRGLYHFPNTSFVVTIIGGSQGAKFLSTLIPNAMKLLSSNFYQQLSIIHQVPQEDIESVRKLYLNNNVRIQSYFDDMPDILKQSNLVIARAGASTIFETLASLVPVIYIPLPHAIDNHQYHNAEQFRQMGTNWIMQQHGLTPQKLANFIESVLCFSHRLLPVHYKIKEFQHVNTTQDLVKKIIAV